ncbi:MAG: hypothetical protein A2Y03_03860 [Omnitrophica WOR_2 bacterium GWF2_38_59]|nr:MAG: hypothetical protein A2Y03_03860 [Omnitrophica WOR_2 bacterium GWF2_38_59]OGX47393.1 MAG: hypothetical protein A2243_01530 [Omnitrophica WOR_2 bacterium RIFOXYA2_FULL_38_17]OGX60495.1 MAG: hypothetical protein A2306_07735 [Omnitrophica WOR_2 bacterium RIFOXYB2_FULL_38_16]
METIKRSLICKILLCFFCVLLICPLAFASVEVGKISYTEGRVDVLRADSGNIVPLREDEPIFVGDIVRTKSNSKSEITFYDKSIVQLAQNTRLEIKDYRLGENNKRESASILVQRGKVRTIIEKYEGVEPFAINTPNAKGTIKGSDIFTFFQGGTSVMLVNSGNLAVVNLAEPELPPVMIPPGNSVVISLEEQPNGPRPYLEIEKKFYEQDTTPPPSISRRNDLDKISGAITKFSGDVRITKEGTTTPRVSQLNDVLNEGDIIETGVDGMIEIKFDNGNAINMKPNSRLVINRLIVDSTNGEFENSFELSMGKVRATVENLKGDSSFQIKTPVAICGVRGTIMFVETTTEDTKTFFEGGFGFLRSSISGLEQKVDIGENSTADNKGNVSIPKFTTQKERMEMGGGWEPGSGIEGYSEPDGTTENYLYDANTGTNKSDSESEDLIDNTKDAGNTSDNILDSLTPDPESVPEPEPTPEPSPGPQEEYGLLSGQFTARFIDYDMLTQGGLVEGSVSSTDSEIVTLRGTVTPPVEGDDKLWVTDSFSGIADDGTGFLGMIAGTKLDNALDSMLYSIYIRDEGAGNYYAGYVLSNNIAGAVNLSEGAFYAEGSLIYGFEYPTSVLPSYLYLESDAIVDHRNIEADIFGDITGSFPVSIESARIQDQSWDIWSFGASGTVSPFVEFPSDDLQAFLGSATYGDFSQSYLLWKMSLVGFDGKMQGNISGRNLYVDLDGPSLGALILDNGDFIGSYEDGYWQGIGAGVGSVEHELQTAAYYEGQFVEFVDGGLYNNYGSMTASMGSTDSILGGEVPILVMGEYSNPEFQNLWIDVGNFEGLTSDGAKLIGFLGGTNNNGSSNAGLLSFYIRPDGAAYRAGYVISTDLVGNFYDDPEIEGNTGFFELDGTMNRYIDLQTAYTTDTMESAIEAGSRGTGIINNNDFSGDIVLNSQNILDQNWGLFYGGAGGGFESLPSAGWNANIGGRQQDGPYIESYFMGEATGNAWENNDIRGEISGDYLSTESLGTFSGDMIGSYDISTSSWEALVLGVNNSTQQLTSSGQLIGNVRDYYGDYNQLTGFIGLTDDIWDGSAFVSMGDFSAIGAEDFIWYGDPQSFYSYDHEWSSGLGRYATFEYEQGNYGSLVGLSVGRGANGMMDGILYSIYVAPNGDFGVAYDNDLTGSYDEELQMYQLYGNLIFSDAKSGYSGFNPEDLYTSLSFSDVIGNPTVGAFSIPGNIDLEGYSSTLASLYNLDWGIFELHGSGTYTGSISDSWRIPNMTGLTSEVDIYRLGGSWLGQITGSTWSDNLVDGELNAVWIQLRRDGTLAGERITDAEVIGNYVDVAEGATFQVASAGEWVEVDTLLDLAGQYDDITALAGANIPITEVYTSLLSGEGSFFDGGPMYATMNMNFYVNDDVYDYVSNGIWAATISGNYETPTNDGWSILVNGDLYDHENIEPIGTVSATLNGTSWTDDGFWQANVSGSATTDITINIEGIAAGTYSGSTEGGSFAGAATGTYQTP